MCVCVHAGVCVCVCEHSYYCIRSVPQKYVHKKPA
jgi:hypothetical protein